MINIETKDINEIMSLIDNINNKIDIRCKEVYGENTSYNHNLLIRNRYIEDKELLELIKIRDYLSLFKTMITRISDINSDSF